MDERKTLKEWYEFNNNILSSKVRFHISIVDAACDIDNYTSTVCEIEGNIDYILGLVGHFKVYRIENWGDLGTKIRVDLLCEAGDA